MFTTPKVQIIRKRKKNTGEESHLKFQDSSFNGLKVTVGTKSVTHAPTLQKQYAPSTFWLAAKAASLY